MPSKAKDLTWSEKELKDAVKSSSKSSTKEKSSSKEKSSKDKSRSSAKPSRSKSRSNNVEISPQREIIEEPRKSRKKAESPVYTPPPPPEKPPSRTPAPPSRETDDYIDEYEDDFEDYDEDFEEDDDDEEPAMKMDIPGFLTRKPSNEVLSLAAAMNSENERLQSADSDRYPSHGGYRSDAAGRSTGGGGDSSTWRTEPSKKTKEAPAINRLNFKAAQSRKTTGRMSKRASELLKIVELDVARFDLFELAPVSEYELFMIGAGGGSTKQTHSQTQEDAGESSAQTEDILTSTRWTQHPPDEGGASELVQSSGGPALFDLSDIESVTTAQSTGRLTAVVQKGGNLICGLLDELSVAVLHREPLGNLADKIGDLQYSIVATHMSQSHNDHVLCVTNDSIVVLNCTNPKQPVAVLESVSPLSCACFDPRSTSVVCAGTLDGSLVCWQVPENGNESRAVYTSAWDRAIELVEIVDIQPLPNSENKAVWSGGMSFEVATLDSRGNCVCWYVMVGGDSLDDPGQNPSAHVQVVRSRNVEITSRSLRASVLLVNPLNPNQLLIGGDLTSTLAVSRFGAPQFPAIYAPICGGAGLVCSLTYCPYNIPAFAASDQFGGLYVWHTDKSSPIFKFQLDYEPVIGLYWYPLAPGNFISVHASGKVAMWDLLQDQDQPTQMVSLPGKPVTAVMSQISTRLARHGRHPLVIGYDDNRVEVYLLQKPKGGGRKQALSEFKALVSSLL